MAAAQSAEQKAAAEKAAAEKQAAEQKAAEDKVAAEQKAAEESAQAEADAAAEESTGQRYVVTGAAVVLPTVDKSERYLYRNAPVDPAAFTPEGIKHALSIGLIAEVK